MGRLAQGNFQPVPLPTRDDELRDLVGSVNLMAGQLDELQRVIKRTERLTLLGQLSGGLAHHLRNDVTGARIAVQLHQRHCREIDQESLAVALRQLTITEEHLKRFLVAGQPQPLRPVACDLRQVFAELRPLVEPACGHRKVDLQINYRPGDSNSPAVRTDVQTQAVQTAAAPPAPLWADPEQLRHLLLNLTLNGIEAAGPGGWVAIDWFGDEQGWHVHVRDSGAGPPADLLERLFEPFATSKREGVGLGLSVARQIAEAHSGTLALRTGQPTCFELTLPRRTAPDAAPIAGLSATADIASAPATESPASVPATPAKYEGRLFLSSVTIQENPS